VLSLPFGPSRHTRQFTRTRCRPQHSRPHRPVASPSALTRFCGYRASHRWRSRGGDRPTLREDHPAEWRSRRHRSDVRCALGEPDLLLQRR
ncbi:MAG: hypothetical protein AVDCRST_MAG87-1473, partial [uncultured Thermomicrobiales bacterium]